MGRSVSACPPADEKESPGEEKPDQKPEDEKPDEKREQPSFRPSKQDPFYLGLRLDIRRARQAARRKIDNARRRQRRATDAGLSRQVSRPQPRAVLAGLPGHAGAAEKRLRHLQDAGQAALRRSLSRHRQGAGPAVPRLQSRPRQLQGQSRLYPGRDGISGSVAARRRESAGRRRRGVRFDLTISCSAGAGAERGRKPESRNTAAVFVDLELQIYRTGGDGGKSQGNLQENSGPTTCPLQACRPNCS